jgi:hypothetical protein
MIRTTTWRPDTCGCVLSYAWDDAVPDDQRVHTPESLTPCAEHAGVRDVNDGHAIVTAENQSKNVAVSAVAAALGWQPAVRHPRVPDVILTPEVNPEFAPHAVPWSFDASRVLGIDATALGVDPTIVSDAVSAALATVVAAKGLQGGSVTLAGPVTVRVV